MDYPKQVMITEVGPRDGLQNEGQFIDTATKIAFIDLLSQSGLRHIEVSSFVSPKAIPQLADAEAVFAGIEQHPGIRYSALVPNAIGMDKALQAGVKEIALFTAASETFNQHNIRCSIAESLDRFRPVVSAAKAAGLRIRAYISCVLGCPYEGLVRPAQVLAVIDKLQEFAVDEISLGDTIGVGTPLQTARLLEAVLQQIPSRHIIMHFHDTYGQAIANILQSLQMGIYQFDSATAGLGGCPYARGASGNVATEDVLYLLHGLGIDTGIDIYKIVEAGNLICQALGKKNQSKVANALLGNIEPRGNTE